MEEYLILSLIEYSLLDALNKVRSEENEERRKRPYAAFASR